MKMLKPCPFCGGKAGLCTNDEGDKYGDGYFVWCCECAAESGCSSTDKEAIEAWNRVSDAVERDTPKASKDRRSALGYRTPYCPTCGIAFPMPEIIITFCPNCGQRIEK